MYIFGMKINQKLQNILRYAAAVVVVVAPWKWVKKEKKNKNFEIFWKFKILLEYPK